MGDPQTLSASYTGPVKSKVFEVKVSELPTSPSTHERINYITQLRSNVKDVQEQINGFLTKEMEEDNAVAGATKISDSKEEENYGEEVLDES